MSHEQAVPEGCEGPPAQLPNESGTGMALGMALGMAWCWRSWLKSRKTAHGKEKPMELEKGARWEAGVEQGLLVQLSAKIGLNCSWGPLGRIFTWDRPGLSSFVTLPHGSPGATVWLFSF